MISKRPYLLRAALSWLAENKSRISLLVDLAGGVEIEGPAMEEYKARYLAIIMSPEEAAAAFIGATEIKGSGCVRGLPRNFSAPIASVVAATCLASGHRELFNAPEASLSFAAPSENSAPQFISGSQSTPMSQRPTLTLVRP